MLSYVIIVAGEASGDRLGAEIIRNLNIPNIRFQGLGGSLMEAQGFESLVSMNRIAVTGFVEVLPIIPLMKSLEVKLHNLIDSSSCIGVILIDYPGFNMRIMEYAKLKHKNFCYLAPPQIWAWKKRRGLKFKDCSVGVFFEMEKNIYQKYNALVEQISHPSKKDLGYIKEYQQNLILYKQSRLLLFVGSRKSRIKQNLKLLLNLALKFIEYTPKDHDLTEILIVVPNQQIKEFMVVELAKNKYVHLLNLNPITVLNENIKHEILVSKSSLIKNYALAIPGTNNLELTIMGIPFISLIKVDFLSYIWRRFFISTKYLSLTNILLRKNVVEEFLFCLYPNSTNAKLEQAIKNLWRMGIYGDEYCLRFFENIEEIDVKMEGQSLISWAKKQIGAWLDV